MHFLSFKLEDISANEVSFWSVLYSRSKCESGPWLCFFATFHAGTLKRTFQRMKLWIMDIGGGRRVLLSFHCRFGSCYPPDLRSASAFSETKRATRFKIFVEGLSETTSIRIRTTYFFVKIQNEPVWFANCDASYSYCMQLNHLDWQPNNLRAVARKEKLHHSRLIDIKIHRKNYKTKSRQFSLGKS